MIYDLVKIARLDSYATTRSTITDWADDVSLLLNDRKSDARPLFWHMYYDENATNAQDRINKMPANTRPTSQRPEPR